MIVSTVVKKLEAAGIEVTSSSVDHPAGGSIILTHGVLIRVCNYHMEVVSSCGKPIANNVLTMEDLLFVVRGEIFKYSI